MCIQIKAKPIQEAKGYAHDDLDNSLKITHTISGFQLHIFYFPLSETHTIGYFLSNEILFI